MAAPDALADGSRRVAGTDSHAVRPGASSARFNIGLNWRHNSLDPNFKKRGNLAGADAPAGNGAAKTPDQRA
jgi:hypothetical protein